MIRGTTSVGARVVSPARPLFAPRSVGPTASLLGPARRTSGRFRRSRRPVPRTVQVAAGGVNSGPLPWRGLSAGDPHLFSAGNATPRPLRHRLLRHGSTAPLRRSPTFASRSPTRPTGARLATGGASAAGSRPGFREASGRLPRVLLAAELNRGSCPLFRDSGPENGRNPRLSREVGSPRLAGGHVGEVGESAAGVSARGRRGFCAVRRREGPAAPAPGPAAARGRGPAEGGRAKGLAARGLCRRPAPRGLHQGAGAKGPAEGLPREPPRGRHGGGRP